MGKEFVPLRKHPSDMTGGELRAALAGRADSEVMRCLLVAERNAIRAGAERETRTMRGLWYSLIKPTLSRAGLLGKRTKGGKDVPWDDKLSIYLAELVRMGQTTYEEMCIVDGSRQRQPAVAMAKTVSDVQLVGAHFPWVILFVEKDTIWPQVEVVASLYGVSAISGGGQPSNACTENTVNEIMQSEAYTDRQPITVLSLTDYDPAGYSIANAQFTQVQETVAGSCDVCHIRLGVEPGQLTPEERAQNTYEPPRGKALREWFWQTGGVDGQPLGIELDALPLSRLRVMFAEAIRQLVDLEARRDDLRAAYIDLVACELLKPGFDAKWRKMREAVKSSPLWDTITGTPLPDDLFRQAARLGLDSIDPLRHNLFKCTDEVRQAMREVLADG
jgi:hypothetical protein